MSLRRFLAAAAAAVALASSSLADGAAKILFPPDMTLTAAPKINVFVFRPEGGGPTPMRVNGKDAPPLEGREFRSGEVALSEGLNILDVGETTLRVYRHSDPKRETFRLETGKGRQAHVFRAYRLHAALPDGCEACHAVEAGKIVPKGQKEACYACHDNFEKAGGTASVHTPVKGGECTACHDPHFSGRPKLLKGEKGCLECHDAPPPEGSVHRAALDGECEGCHDPHAGPGPRQLVRDGNALCAGCHKDFHRQHRSAKVKREDVAIPDGFPVDKGEMSCLGCHYHHQSTERRLFRKAQGELCKSCHRG